MAAPCSAGSAAQPPYPEGHMPLSQPTSRSARMGTWQLGVFRASQDEYEYTWEGETRQGQRMHTAEQPADFKSTRDCETWLASLSQQEITSQPPLQRLSTAVKYLQAAPSRQRREDIQRIAKDWGVMQKSRTSGACQKKQKTGEVIDDLEGKVIHEATRLRKLQLRRSGEASSSWSALHQAFAHP